MSDRLPDLPEMGELSARLSAVTEQAAMIAQDVARLLARFHGALLAHGMCEDSALELTRDYFEQIASERD